MGLFDGMDMDWGQIATGMPTPGAVPQPGFDDRFGAAFPRSPIAPEALAANLAARGVPPPKQDIPVGAALTGNDGVINPTEPYRMPDQRSVDNWRADADVLNGGGAAAVTPTAGGTAPMNIQSPVQQQQVAAATAPTDVSAAKKSGGDNLLDALKGIKAPPAPTIQHLGTPSAPKPTGNIKGGNIMAMLQALNAGASAGDRNLPATLAAALRRG